MTPLQITGALVALFAVMAVPRLAQTAKGLFFVIVIGVAIGALVWFGWAADLATATDRAVPLIGIIVVGAAFGSGALARAVVLVGRKRDWPGVTDLVMSLGVAAVFGFGFLRLFDVL